MAQKNATKLTVKNGRKSKDGMAYNANHNTLEATRKQQSHIDQERTAQNIYIQFGDKFDWPDIENTTESGTAFCYGMRDQIGILSNGTVVPCCLDNNGEINLGNVFENNLNTIINSNRALNIYNGFSNRKACEELCKKCSFARKF